MTPLHSVPLKQGIGWLQLFMVRSDTLCLFPTAPGLFINTGVFFCAHTFNEKLEDRREIYAEFAHTIAGFAFNVLHVNTSLKS